MRRLAGDARQIPRLRDLKVIAAESISSSRALMGTISGLLVVRGMETLSMVL